MKGNDSGGISMPAVLCRLGGYSKSLWKKERRRGEERGREGNRDKERERESERETCIIIVLL